MDLKENSQVRYIESKKRHCKGQKWSVCKFAVEGVWGIVVFMLQKYTRTFISMLLKIRTGF